MSIPLSFQTSQPKLTIPTFPPVQSKLTIPTFPPVQSKLTIPTFPPLQTSQPKLTIPTFPPVQPKLTIPAFPPLQTSQSKLTIPAFPPVQTSQSKLTVPAFPPVQTSQSKLTIPSFSPLQTSQPKLTIPAFSPLQPKQPTSVPQPSSTFQPKQPTSVPIFSPLQPRQPLISASQPKLTVPVFSPVQTSQPKLTVPVFSPIQPKQPTSVPQSKSTNSTFQPKQPTSVPQPLPTVQTKQQFQTIISPQNQQFQISASPQQKLISIPPSSGFQLQKIRTSTTSPQNQQFQTITSPQTPQFQISTQPQRLTGTLVPSGIQPQQFQTPTASIQTPQFQTIAGVLLPPATPKVSKSGPSVLQRKVAPTLASLSTLSGPILSSSSPRTKSDQIWKTFRRDDLFLLENDGQTAYHRRADQKKTTVHWGQRKLALTTLAMINLFWNPEQIQKLTIVYAGSAPGTNLKFVMEMYPQIEWYLYDPHPVGFNKEIKAKHNVHIFEGDTGWFTDQIAEEWKDRDDIFFISDVRTDDITETGIWNNMKMQEKWVKIIKPVVAMLKFRLPYSNLKFSNVIDYTKGYAPYLAGIVMKQPWAGRTSTETRLLIPRSSMINGVYPIHNWNIKVYEDKMFHLNSVIRELVYFYNPFYLKDSTKRATAINPPELLNDWDSLVETTILNDLLTKTSTVINRLEGIKGLSNLLTISLRPKMFATRKEPLSLNYLRKNPGHFKEHFRPRKN